MADKKITDLQLRSSVTDDLQFPSDDTIQSYRVTGAQMFTYLRGKLPNFSNEIAGLQLATSVASNALTIAVKTNAGTDPSSTDKIRVAFRSATLTSGAFVLREITAPLSMVVSNGSTLGQVNGQPSRIFVYLIDASGTPELAVSHSLFGDDALVSTTAEGGAGAADSGSVLYSTTARTNVAIRLIGYLDNTQTTAGTWAAVPTQIQLLTHKGKGKVTVQKFTSGSGTYYTPAGCTRIRIRMVGGGGGSGGSFSTAGSAGATGGAGGTSSFGSSLLTANGGAGTITGGGAGGVPTVNSPAIDILSRQGSSGTGGGNVPSGYVAVGGFGGGSPFGGGGLGGSGGVGAGSPIANTGGGAGGAPGNNGFNNQGGGGAGAGAYIEAMINNPDGSYAYSVGAGGTAGGAGTNGYAGATGATGCIIVEEFYD